MTAGGANDFAGGNRKRALENLTKAMEIDPTNAFNHYYLAEFYETAGQDAEAAKKLDSLAALTPTADVDAPDLKFIQLKGEKLRKSLKVQRGT